MERTTSQASSGQVPCSPGATAPLHQVFKANFYEPEDYPVEDSHRFSIVLWGARHTSWVLAVYATGVLIATSYASRAVYELGESFKNVIDTLQLDASSSDVIDRAVNVALLVSWLLAGGSIIASVISILWKLLNAAKRERFKHLAKEGSINSRTAGMCMRFNALRVLLNTVHVFSMLTCVWFVLMLCVLVALLVLLVVGRNTADSALEFVQTAEQNANTFTSDIFVRIEEFERTLNEMSATINTYCRPRFCPPVITTTQADLEELSDEMGVLLTAVEDAQACPSASCINLDLFWFLEASGCVCASETIQEVFLLSTTAKKQCIRALVALMIAFLCALLMLSKTAMNLKSHIKDEAWIRRVRRIFLKLQEKGVRLPSNETGESRAMFDAPMASMNDIWNATLPPIATPRLTTGEAASAPLPLLTVRTPRTPRGAGSPAPRSCSGSPTKAVLAQLQKGMTNRNYLGIEPPVSLGSDAGGSGPLPMTVSRRLSKATADGSLGGQSSGLGMFSVGRSGLGRENSGASNSSAGEPRFGAGARAGAGLQKLLSIKSMRRGRSEGDLADTVGGVNSGRWRQSGGPEGVGGDASKDTEALSGGGVRNEGWVVGAVRSVLACGSDDGYSSQTHAVDASDGLTLAGGFKRGVESSSPMSTPTHESGVDVATGFTVLPPQTLLAAADVSTGGEDPLLRKVDSFPAFTSPQSSVLGHAAAGAAWAAEEVEIRKSFVDASQLESDSNGFAGFEAPPPVSNVELSVIHELARESSMTLASAHGSMHQRHASGSAFGTPEVTSARQASFDVSPAAGGSHTVSENAVDGPGVPPAMYPDLGKVDASTDAPGVVAEVSSREAPLHTSS